MRKNELIDFRCHILISAYHLRGSIVPERLNESLIGQVVMMTCNRQLSFTLRKY